MRSTIDPQAGSITLESDALRVECTPTQGFTITSLIDRRSGADALWRRCRHDPAPCTRALGSSGDASIETFLDVFVGGWFEMFPDVGYPAPGDATSLLHGELVRLPWEVGECTATTLEARTRTVRRPFEVTRRLELTGGALQIRERIEHVGNEPVPYLWGHHPCFDRATFAGGRVELDVKEAHVPAPALDPNAALLRPDQAIRWPTARSREGQSVDLSWVPHEPDGRVDHVCLTLAAGRVRLTAPAFQQALTIEFDLEYYPFVLIWQNFRASGGWPFWGEADTFAIEFSSNPGRTVPDAQAAGAIRYLEPGQVIEATTELAWEDLRT